MCVCVLFFSFFFFFLLEQTALWYVNRGVPLANEPTTVSHTTDDLVFIWDHETPLVVDDKIELPQLDLVSNVTGDFTQVYATGDLKSNEQITSSIII